MKQAQQKQPAVIIRAPLIELWRSTPFVCCWLVLALVQNNFKSGPFTSVMIMAPATVAAVPSTLLWLRMHFNFTFSSLKINMDTISERDKSWEVSISYLVGTKALIPR